MGVALGASLALASAADKPVRAQRVTQDVWFVQGEAAMGSSANRNFISNAGFVVTGKGVVVIDLVVHVPRRGVLFAGDLAFRGRSPSTRPTPKPTGRASSACRCSPR